MRISDRATQLFLEQGFEGTTIAEITESARVSKKTVTNDFAHKEDPVLGHQDEFVGPLASAVTTRQPGEPAPAAPRCSSEAIAEQNPVAGCAGPDSSRMISESRTLGTCLRTPHDQREQALEHPRLPCSPKVAFVQVRTRECKRWQEQPSPLTRWLRRVVSGDGRGNHRCRSRGGRERETGLEHCYALTTTGR
ncbi:TetR/AcrR family transcriptional regulator [Saccharopolyspora sp. NPDC000359]|uniref:TetR/AcrR family transcriptional regulator n=1 Tax=Saccharopolyspora sp. NPDC000359 TaxID=3154251 RepID=UPI0033298925